MTTRIESWAREAYKQAGNDYPWEMLPQSSRDRWVEFITDSIVDRLGEVSHDAASYL